MRDPAGAARRWRGSGDRTPWAARRGRWAGGRSHPRHTTRRPVAHRTAGCEQSGSVRKPEPPPGQGPAGAPPRQVPAGHGDRGAARAASRHPAIRRQGRLGRFLTGRRCRQIVAARYLCSSTEVQVRCTSPGILSLQRFGSVRSGLPGVASGRRQEVLVARILNGRKRGMLLERGCSDAHLRASDADKGRLLQEGDR
jgi:hypothetical protein